MNQFRVLAVNAALNNAGVPYLWGGNHPGEGGLDCSGAVLHWWRKAGIEIDDQRARDMYKDLIKTTMPMPGDAAFYGGKFATHVVMVLNIGATLVIGANGGGIIRPNELLETYVERMADRGACVRVENNGYLYRSGFLGFRKMPIHGV